MFKLRRIWFLSNFLAVISVLFICFTAEVIAGNWLITHEEAKMQIRDGSYADPISAIEGSGPVIVVKRPKMLQRLSSPIDILVSFEPGVNGGIADMQTLKVTLVGWIDIDITGRLTKYISGTNLDVKQADLPSGDHRLRMSIKDVAGKVNERDVIITVMKK